LKVFKASEQEYEAASHEPPDNPGALKKVLARKSDLLNGRVQMVNWSLCPAGSAFARHYHEDMQEVFIILNGEVDLQAGDKAVTLRKGDMAVIDPLEIHQMRNACGEDVEYLVFGISTERGGHTIVVDR